MNIIYEKSFLKVFIGGLVIGAVSIAVIDAVVFVVWAQKIINSI